MTDNSKIVQLPLDATIARTLRAGDWVRLQGALLGARDAVHRRLFEAIQQERELPVALMGETIYYVGPCPGRGEKACGSAGPTTSGRMDRYTPALLEKGLLGMIGKGKRSEAVVTAIKDRGAVYFAALGGAGAIYGTRINSIEVVAYPELGPEALFRMEVVDFPAIVAIDSRGCDLYEAGPASFRRDL
ncbi:MAG TPA: TRZ/ATZ family protein [Firmicutes bacterium]|jgi:fumarate hydratase subunit beta|nr:TRZ/ATZ family protein [Bacillota bacterium]HBG43696.1 TRZ/ATZ family protein [Bacillota bacterium]HBL69312.1 TRZ/ATZ family protein [Bacillota bacterium]HBR24158.1 TRZ/ATZ family protein [Bacillota bacterium]HCM18784.1 TRZ/ATZ family protein [Bacillota bacterium]